MLLELKKVGDIIDRILREDDFPDRIQPDYLREAVLDYPVRGGKRLRPALLMWSCGIYGGSESQSMLPAAAVEVFHNWTLVHDDIIDDDEVRRGAPSCHRRLAARAAERFPNRPAGTVDKFGRDMAILCGDLQQAWANSLLLKSVEHGVPPAIAVALARRLQELTSRELISGEALDVEFPMRELSGIAVAEVETMLYLKTGILLQFSVECGAALALETTDFQIPEIRNLGRFALAAGVAFQLRDDYLGLYGDFRKFGKTIGADLREAKPTLLLLKAFELLPEDGRRQLQALLKLERYSEAALQQARTLVGDCGAAAFAAARAEQLAAEAHDILKTLPANRYRGLLQDLVDYLLTREL